MIIDLTLDPELTNFLKMSNEQKVMARPSWKLMNEINYLNSSYVDSIENAKRIADTVVNIGSSVKE